MLDRDPTETLEDCFFKFLCKSILVLLTQTISYKQNRMPRWTSSITVKSAGSFRHDS
jgi:hypothetical protein